MTHGHDLRWGECWWEVGYWVEEDKGEKGDNCNSIINKIYFKNLKSKIILKIINKRKKQTKYNQRH